MKKALATLCAVSLFACQDFTPPRDSVLLPIPDRPWHPDAPPEGWCGEVSIQMAALHFGAWLPQRLVHTMGKPTHVDLWETDMPLAMTTAGLKFETWTGSNEDALLQWIVNHVRAGHPVIVGVKAKPTTHPEWDIDHLMPVVGFSPTAIVFNSNMEQGQVSMPWSVLVARQQMTLTGPRKKQFAWAVTGLEPATGVSLRVVSEDAGLLVVEVRTRAAVLKQDDLNGTIITVVLDGGTLELPAETAARFSSTAP